MNVIPVQTLGWKLWATLPVPVRGLGEPAVAFARRRAVRWTDLPPGDPPELQVTAVEANTLFGTLWLDGDDERMLPWIRRHGTWEADVVRLLRATLRPGGVFVDVGANVGFHTLAAARIVGPTGRVVAVEPLPSSVALLRANLWRHGVDWAEVAPVAAAAEPGSVRLAFDDHHRSGAHLAASGLEVAAARLDDLVPDLRVDVLKIDVEGAEPLVLRGATRLLQRSPDLVAIVEFRADRHASGESAPEVLSFYESLGFELCLLRTSGEPRPVSTADLMHRARALESLNIVLRRRGRSLPPGSAADRHRRWPGPARWMARRGP